MNQLIKIKPLLKQKAFTLIELLVVIAIIGVLSSVVLTNLNKSRQKAYLSKLIQDVNAVQNALELYYQDNGHYPDPVGDNVPSDPGADGGHDLSNIIDIYLAKYISFDVYPIDTLRKIDFYDSYSINYSRHKDYPIGYLNSYCGNIKESDMPYTIWLRAYVELTPEYFLAWDPDGPGVALGNIWDYCFPPKLK